MREDTSRQNALKTLDVCLGESLENCSSVCCQGSGARKCLLHLLLNRLELHTQHGKAGRKRCCAREAVRSTLTLDASAVELRDTRRKHVLESLHIDLYLHVHVLPRLVGIRHGMDHLAKHGAHPARAPAGLAAAVAFLA